MSKDKDLVVIVGDVGSNCTTRAREQLDSLMAVLDREFEVEERTPDTFVLEFRHLLRPEFEDVIVDKPDECVSHPNSLGSTFPKNTSQKVKPVRPFNKRCRTNRGR